MHIASMAQGELSSAHGSAQNPSMHARKVSQSLFWLQEVSEENAILIRLFREMYVSELTSLNRESQGDERE